MGESEVVDECVVEAKREAMDSGILSWVGGRRMMQMKPCDDVKLSADVILLTAMHLDCLFGLQIMSDAL